MKKFIIHVMSLILLLVTLLQGYTVGNTGYAQETCESNPKVSVIIPVYNVETYLRECMNSIINQSLNDIEIICVNDGSTDNSLEILKEYEKKDNRVVVIDKENGGASSARNIGLKVAKGEYIAFVDSDDYLDLNAYELTYNRAIETDADILVFGEEQTKFTPCIYTNPFKALVEVKGKSYTCPWNKLYKKDLFNNDDTVFNEKAECFNDECFMIKIFPKAKNIVYTDLQLYHYRRQRDGSLQTSFNIKKKANNVLVYAKYSVDTWQNNNYLCENGDKLLYKITHLAYRIFDKLNEDEKRIYVEKLFDILKSNVYNLNNINKLNRYTKNRLLKLESYLSEDRRHKTYEGLKENSISMALATDNNYVMPTVVAMTSVLEHARVETFYDFNLLISGKLDESNKKTLLSLKNKYNCNIKLIDMKDAFVGDKEVGTRITTPMYYRLRLPEILADKDKCIYIDGDTITCKDLTELYNINIDDYYLAGVKAAGMQSIGERYANLLKIPSMNQYINSGVLLMNLKKMREDKIVDKFSDFIENEVNKQPKITCPDQDTINSVCHNKIYHLPFKYNMMTQYKATEDGVWEKYKKYQNCFSKQEWDEGRLNPVIIHYCDRRKPWLTDNTILLDQWKEIAQKTDLLKTE